MRLTVLPTALLLLLSQCATELRDGDKPMRDPHSYSQPDVCSVKHLNLDISLDFYLKQITGIATYELRLPHGDSLLLDMRDLQILSVQEKHPRTGLTKKLNYRITPPDSILGSALVIYISKDARLVSIQYRTMPESMALQWIDSQQTQSKKMPFFYTQSQSIYARSWIPCPDGPGMRFTYHANVQVSPGMMAVMSAENPQGRNPDGIYSFAMNIPIPTYLIALAAGDFDFKALDERCGVYAEPHVLDKAIHEFADLPKMLEAAESLFGPYPWGRYDVLVLPPSFPFGGMENPKITFATPTVIAGDRSLTSLLAHELAHSWSGNKVTNATWNDFWLNEGFTTYFECRIMEKLYGRDFADMISILGLQDLRKLIAEKKLPDEMTRLKLDLKDKDPEESLSDIAYEKGKLLLRYLEERIGRKDWDPFLKSYFDHFQFTSNSSEGFIRFLESGLLTKNSPIMDTVRSWIYDPGLIPFEPTYSNAKFEAVFNEWQSYQKTGDVAKINCADWNTQQWLQFIRLLPKEADAEFCRKLDRHFRFSETTNAEIACAWFEYAIQHQYGQSCLPAIEKFLTSIGRRRFVLPLYEGMMANNLKDEARQIFKKASPLYHPITKASVIKTLANEK